MADERRRRQGGNVVVLLLLLLLANRFAQGYPTGNNVKKLSPRLNFIGSLRRARPGTEALVISLFFLDVSSVSAVKKLIILGHIQHATPQLSYRRIEKFSYRLN